MQELKQEIKECLPEKHIIAQYVDRNDVKGLAEYFRAVIIDIRMVLNK
jgi:hypothetical protein